MARETEAPPIACALAAGDFQTRVRWIADLNARALKSARPDGLTLELTYAPEARADVLELVRRERECCAFLDFAVHEDDGALRVVVTAPEAARESVPTLFQPLAAGRICGCS